MKPTQLVPVGELLGESRVLAKHMHRITHQEWEQIVGLQLARRTQPEKIIKGVLSVVVASSAWAQELSLLSATILDRLRARGRKVEQLRFKVGKPTIPKAPEPPVSRVAKRPLPPGLLRALQQVDDPELRRAIAEAAAYSVGGRTPPRRR